MTTYQMLAERPLYHLQPEANWMNDPNGPIQWNGQYHMFYQHHPYSPFWGPIHWGHAISRDLVRWTHLPLALTPTPNGPDADGCWSGCAVDDAGVATLIYTAVQRDAAYQGGYRQTQCVATSGDGELREWQKYGGNPVIAAPPAGTDPQFTAFRDPCVWRHDGHWFAVVGSGVEQVGGRILLYRSDDLRHWDYLGILYERSYEEMEPVWTGSIWECPQFFPLGDEYVLIFGVWDEGKLHYTVAAIGHLSGLTFTPRDLRRFDLGADYYAPSSMCDTQGRRLLWGWSWEARRRLTQKAVGWSGMLSLPRVLTLRPDGLLGVEPIEELATLRGRSVQYHTLHLAPGTVYPLEDIQSDCFELAVQIEPGDAATLGVLVRRSPDGEEATLIEYDRQQHALFVDRTHASLDRGARTGRHGGVIPGSAGDTVTLRIFVDRTIVEVYANGTACLTERIYPTRSDSLGVALIAQGGPALIPVFEAWELSPQA